MQIITKLGAYYDFIEKELDKEPGTVFNYASSSSNGLKIIAEFMCRIRRQGFAILFIPTKSTFNLISMPTNKFRNTFEIENRLDKLYKETDYLLCIQREADLGSGNYLVMSLDSAGTQAILYIVLKYKAEAIKLTEIDFSYSNNISNELNRLYRLCSSELDEMIMKRAAGHSNFGSL